MDAISSADLVTSDPTSIGAWQVVGLSGVIGTHAALLHTGQVLFFTRPEDPSHKWNNLDNGLPGDDQRPHNAPDVTLSTIIATSGPNAYRPEKVHVEHNPFCSGHTFLADGRLLVAGGDKKNSNKVPRDAGTPDNTKYGVNSLRVFTPSATGTGGWDYIGELEDRRWYPTCTLLADGRVFIVSGSGDDQENYNNQTPTCETYPPTPGGPQYLHLLDEAWPYHSFPFVFMLPSGALFLFVKDSSYYLRFERDKFGRDRWVVENGPKLSEQPAKHYPNNATAVLLPLLPNHDPEKSYAAEVLIIGGGGENMYPHFGRLTENVDALHSCFRLGVHPRRAGDAWRQVKSMKNPRVMPDGVLLPDGTVLVVNGASKGFAGGNAATGPVVPEHAVKEAELYDPIKDEWHTLAAAKCTRLYHSTALLLPDARVLVAGSDHQVNADRPLRLPDGTERNVTMALSYEYQVEVFSPPYLFKGIPRPVIGIEDIQKQLAYGQQFEIQVDNLDQMELKDLTAVLIQPSSVTHNNNMSQRLVGLKMVGKSQTRLLLEAPPSGNIAPPGYYMLFILHRGVPSEAQFIQLLLGPSAGISSADFPVDSNVHIDISNYEPSGMALWLQADTGVVTETDGSVRMWSDRSTHGVDVFWKRNLAPESKIAWQKPPRVMQNELNGHAVIRFSLIDYKGTQWGGYLESAHSFLPGSDPYAVFLVTHPWPSGNKGPGPESRGTPGMVGWGDFSDPGSNNPVVRFRLGPGARSNDPPSNPDFTNHLPKEPGKASVVTYWGVAQLSDDSVAPVSRARAVLLETSFDGANWQMRLNGDLLMDPQPINDKDTGHGPLIIGRNGNDGDFFRGDIAEMLIYNRKIEDDERTEIQEYLRNRYALW